MRNTLLPLALGLLIGVLPFTTRAEAQNRNCATYEQVVERLASGYGESPRTIGLGSNNTTVVQFANEQTGTWTIVVVNPDNIACLIAAGETWTILAAGDLL